MTTEQETIDKRRNLAEKANNKDRLKIGMKVKWVYGPLSSRKKAGAIIKIEDGLVYTTPHIGRGPALAWWAVRPVKCMKSKEL